MRWSARDLEYRYPEAMYLSARSSPIATSAGLGNTLLGNHPIRVQKECRAGSQGLTSSVKVKPERH